MQLPESEIRRIAFESESHFPSEFLSQHLALNKVTLWASPKLMSLKLVSLWPTDFIGQASAFEMNYFMSGGALNSTRSLALTSWLTQSTVILRFCHCSMWATFLTRSSLCCARRSPRNDYDAEHPIYAKATFGLFSVREKSAVVATTTTISRESAARRRQNGAISRLSVIV